MAQGLVDKIILGDDISANILTERYPYSGFHAQCIFFIGNKGVVGGFKAGSLPRHARAIAPERNNLESVVNSQLAMEETY